MSDLLGQFKEVWTVDSEFYRPLGCLPDPICCVVGLEMKSGREVRLWTEHGAPQPFDTGPDNLFVGQYSSVEWLAFRVLGWRVPMRVIDTYVEGRQLTNGEPGRKGPKEDKREGRRRGCGLTDLAWRYGVTAMTETLKDSNRKLAMRGGPWSDEERTQMLDYCMDDVTTTAKVFEAMVPEIIAPRHGLAHALTRGRYMRADAAMNYIGIPVDLAGCFRNGRWGVKLLVLGLPAGFMLPSVVGRCRHMIASERNGEPI
jgi:DNA polymerase I